MAKLLLGAVLLSVAPVGQAMADPTYLPFAYMYAPDIRYALGEPNLPTSVEWFLPRTRLTLRDEGCHPSDFDIGPATVTLLQSTLYTSTCGGHIIKASGTRSASRTHTYVLIDVPNADKRGSLSTADWPLYLHAFRNKYGGWSLQYWAFYAYNTGKKYLGIEIGFHGGDWEMFQIDLDSAGTPKTVVMTGHTQMEVNDWAAVTLTQDTHPVVYAESGGHEMHLSATESGPYIDRGTWPGSLVIGLNGSQTPLPAGPIVDIGTRLQAHVGWLNYSGLWGSLGSISSGYWGPPFNETALGANSFLTAWCFNIADPQENSGGRHECYPDDVE